MSVFWKSSILVKNTYIPTSSSRLCHAAVFLSTRAESLAPQATFETFHSVGPESEQLIKNEVTKL